MNEVLKYDVNFTLTSTCKKIVKAAQLAVTLKRLEIEHSSLFAIAQGRSPQQMDAGYRNCEINLKLPSTGQKIALRYWAIAKTSPSGASAFLLSTVLYAVVGNYNPYLQSHHFPCFQKLLLKRRSKTTNSIPCSSEVSIESYLIVRYDNGFRLS